MRPTYQRLAVLATGVFLVTGCGDKGLDKPLPATNTRIEVKVPWPDGGRIPRKYTCDGANQRPAVSGGGIGTPESKDVAIVMTDPDAPGGTFVHWTSWDGAEGKNSFGKTGYDGPCPPKGGDPHKYVVTVYELSRRLGLPSGAEPEKVLETIQKLAVASGSATGTYGR